VILLDGMAPIPSFVRGNTNKLVYFGSNMRKYCISTLGSS
jgi:hypothetical protein